MCFIAPNGLRGIGGIDIRQGFPTVLIQVAFPKRKISLFFKDEIKI